jgi:PKD repeat protein
MKKKLTLFRIDEQVFFTMVGLGFICLLILGFRFAFTEKCSPIKIQLPRDTVVVGSLVTFKVETIGGRTFTWDFRDGVVKKEEIKSVSHIFKTPGKYTIKVEVDGRCSGFSDLVVIKASTKIEKQSLAMFTGPSIAHVNEQISFEDTSSVATSWEWQFEDGGDIKSKTRRATHTYSIPGRKLITLVINGRVDMTISRFIDVKDTSAENDSKVVTRKRSGSKRPIVIPINNFPSTEPIKEVDVPKPELESFQPVVKAPDITESQMRNMLLEVVERTKSAQQFSAYLCENLNAKVTYNRKNITFVEMCSELEKLRKKSKVKKLSVKISRDPTTNCIQSMEVTLLLKWIARI